MEIVEYAATRVIKLKNLDTGTEDECFDDSAVVSDSNFDFMQVGHQYECKIKLFGRPLSDRTDDSVVCLVTNEQIDIGHRKMVEVQIGHDKYYIPRQKVCAYLNAGQFIFCFTRKELVQVNNIIQGDFL